jgi:TolA-binding protein
MLKRPLTICFVLYFVLLLNGCGKSDKELWSNAQQNLKSGKTNEAINDFEKLVKNHPESPNASISLYEIANLYHSKVVKDITADESLKRGIIFYKRVYSEYPKSKEAPKALFMVGFIQANEQGRFDSATVSYKLFLEKYPNDEMASSAKTELDNMGVPPKEIIARKLESKK